MKMNRWKAIAASFLLLAFLAVLLTSLMGPDSNQGKPRFTLKDGSVVYLEDVAYGTNHSFSHTYYRFPSPFPIRIGIGRGGSEKERLGFFLSREMTGRNSPRGYRWVSQYFAVDEHGCRYGGTGTSMSSTRSKSFYGGSFDDFPRNLESFQLVIYNDQGEESLRIPVRVPEKARRNLAPWQPEIFPVTKTNGTVEATLKKLNWRKSQHTSNNLEITNYYCWPTVSFAVEGKHTHAWSYRNLHLTDAAGNEYNNNHIPCVRHHAFKLRVWGFRTQEAEFSKEEVLKIENVPLPSADTLVYQDRTYSLGTNQFKLLWVAGAGNVSTNNIPIHRSWNYSSSTSGGREDLQFKIKHDSSGNLLNVDITSDMPHIAFHLPELPEHLRIDVRIIDGKGERVNFHDSHHTEGIRYAFLRTKNPPSSVTVEVMIHEGKPFDFIVGSPDPETIQD